MVLAVNAQFGVPGVQYVPALGGALYVVLGYLFYSRPRKIGNGTLAILVFLRGLLNLPWTFLGDVQRSVVHVADQAFVMLIGLTLIVSELIHARMIIASNIDQLRQQGQTLQALNAKLKSEHKLAAAANRAKSQFLANTSHELRTPLNAIIGFSDLIANQRMGPVNAPYAGYGQDINSAGQHLLAIVDEVLEMSRIEAGKVDLELAATSLRSTTALTLSLTRHLADARDVTYSEDIPEDADNVHADKQALGQILVNLLSNAFKYSKRGGHVSLSAKRNGPFIEIEVTDDGIGIKADDVDWVFEPFSVVNSASSRVQGGIGLGLSITRHLVELHHGQISLKSEWGRGTQVSLLLPIEQSAGLPAPG